MAGRQPKSNKDLWRIYARVVRPDVEVAWVPAHLDEEKAKQAGLRPEQRLGNARADELATRGIREHNLDPVAAEAHISGCALAARVRDLQWRILQVCMEVEGRAPVGQR